MRICFLVGSVAISGGTYVILQHASYLSKQGYDITLAVMEAFTPKTLEWHDKAAELRYVPIDQAMSEIFDLVIATWWKTALQIDKFNAIHYAYFVQSIESRFYPECEVCLRELIDSSYHLPVSYITEAAWIRDYLAERFHQKAELVHNGIRKDLYKLTGSTILSRKNGQPRVLVEGHFGVSFKNTALAIRLAREAGCNDIWLLTGSSVSWLPKVSKIFSNVPILSTPDIYRSCDILVKLSTVEGMFGPPLEIFHCGGTAVVFNVTGHDEYIVDGVNALVVSQKDVDGVVEAIKSLLEDVEKLQHLKEGALRTAETWPSWEQSSEKFHNWVAACLNGNTIEREVLSEMVERAWSDYVRDEQARLQMNPAIVRRHKLSAVASRWPASFVKIVKQLEAVGEVVFCSRKAY